MIVAVVEPVLANMPEEEPAVGLVARKPTDIQAAIAGSPHSWRKHTAAAWFGCVIDGCLPSSQLGNDRGEGAGGVGAEDEVGEPDFLVSSLDLLGSGGGIVG